jgi:aspartyl-tRNA(Asn)/glutamyl-tRNA(Gln) amidotransferase subunit A
VLPLSTSLDHAGPLAKTVQDAAAVLSAIAGYDPLDPSSSAQPVDDYMAALKEEGSLPLKNVRIGYMRSLLFPRS